MGNSRGFALLVLVFLCAYSFVICAGDDLVKEPVSKPQIMKITVTVRMPDGRIVDQLVDPRAKEAIFWSDSAIEKILAPFYEKYERWVGEKAMMDLFGGGIMSLLKDFRLETRDSEQGREIRLSAELIRYIWKNLGFAYLEKMPPCHTGGYPPQG